MPPFSQEGLIRAADDGRRYGLDFERFLEFSEDGDGVSARARGLGFGQYTFRLGTGAIDACDRYEPSASGHFAVSVGADRVGGAVMTSSRASNSALDMLALASSMSWWVYSRGFF